MDNWTSKQKIIVQVVCLLLSMGLWFYVTNIENPLRSYDLSKVPVELLNMDSLNESNLALAPNQEYYVTLKLEGQSQDIFNVQRSDFKVTVDLKEYALKVGENKIPVNIVESPSNISVKSNSGLSITLNIEELIEKDVPVKSKIDIVAKSSYYASNPIFNPSVITVKGAASLVDQVEYVVAQGQEHSIESTIVKNYIVVAMDDNDNIIKGIELSQNWVEATIKVNEGKTVPVKVNTTGALKDGLRIKSIEAAVNQIGLSGPEEILDNISEISTEYIDLSKVLETTAITTNLIIPEGVVINSETQIVVNIALDKVVTKEFNISYTLIGQATGIKITPKSDKIKVVVEGFPEDIDSLTEENIKAELDIAAHTTAGTYSETPKVTISGINSNATIKSVDKVEFTIEVEESTVTPEE